MLGMTRTGLQNLQTLKLSDMSNNFNLFENLDEMDKFLEKHNFNKTDK